MFRWITPEPEKPARPLSSLVVAIATLCLAALFVNFLCWLQFCQFIVRYREPLLLWCLP
ncbi:MAG TPA: hypothetical protein GX699_00855 [Firmicutes bacterium]|nr:hypothetical protein [Bacillota bacterium]